MASKRFDDIDKKARELEAQAKKLRREKQAAKVKAYADALVTVFPEVKDMGSADEVLAFVKTLRKSTEQADTGANTSATQTAVVREPVNVAESSDGYQGSQGAQDASPAHRPFD